MSEINTPRDLDQGNAWQISAPQMTIDNGNIYGQGVPLQSPSKPREDTEYTKKVKQNFHIFGGASFIYACLYAFCMYKNSSGVTYPFFVAGSLLFICFCFGKLEISLKKGSRLYMGSMMLLGISTFCTDDGRIIAMNKTGVLLLTISFLLSTLYETKRWALGKTLSAIFQVLFLAFGELGRPFSDAAWYCKNKLDRKKGKILYVAAGLALTIPIFLAVFGLLISADAVFRDMSERLFRHLNIRNILQAVFMVCGMFLAAYCILSYLCKKDIVEEAKDHRKGEPLVAIPIAAILSMLYLVFSVIQILYLFVGGMQLPDGYTYAEYAREGFFQLLFVSLLNLVLVLIGMSYFRSSKVLKIVLTVMSLCTFIMIASSAMRMIIYIQYYYLTFLRIFVLWSLAVLFLIFAGVIAAIIRESFPLFRYSMIVVTVFYLALSFAHPDYWIARINVEGMQTEARSDFFQGEAYSDYYFLSQLSADAAPVLLKYAEREDYDLNVYYWKSYEVLEYYGGCTEDNFAYYYMVNLRERVGETSLRRFNLSRFGAGLEVLSQVTAGM